MGRDRSLARRQVAINSEAGIDGGMADLNLAVLDWIDSRIAGGGDRDFRSRVREEIDGLLDAGRRGRQRGAELSALWQREGHPDPLSSCSTTAGFLLRHPNDHYFRAARAAVSDEELCEMLDAQIAVMAASYDRLIAPERFALALERHCPHPAVSEKARLRVKDDCSQPKPATSSHQKAGRSH